MPTTVTLTLAVLGLFIWIAVMWRRTEAASRELETARTSTSAMLAELRSAKAEILELQMRVDRLDGGDGSGPQRERVPTSE